MTSIGRDCNKAIRFLRGIRRACAAHRVPVAAAYARALSMYAFEQYSRKEILAYGLFVPAIRETLPVRISKERSLAKLAAFNPPALQYLTEDKDEFHRVAVQCGLPVPATVGWIRDGAPFDSHGQRFDSLESWARHLDACLPGAFIAKDRAGAYGSGFRAFERIGDRFVGVGDGKSRDAKALAVLLAEGSDGDVIVQERLYDHPTLTTLSGRRGLQTARINTLLRDDGRVELLFFMFKVLAGHMLSDNFSMGTSGNLIAFGDLERGVLRGAVTLHDCGSGMQRVDRHPQTGVAFDGFRLPWWQEALALVQRAQRCLPDLPTLGWDVALTANGPVIVEANARWDPPYYAPFILASRYWNAIFGKGSQPEKPS